MAASTPAAAPRECVAVFGAAWAKPDSELYARSVELGAALGRASFDVVSGGYAGTMEGVSKGAVSVAGASAIGVTVPELFSFRGAGGNAYLSEEVRTSSLLSRIDAMLSRAPRFIIVLPGTLGTLTELCCAMNTSLLYGLAGRAKPRIYAWRKPWALVVEQTGDALGLDAATRALVTFVDGVEECVELIVEAAHGGKDASSVN